MASALFRFIEDLQADLPWGAFLDAGTGVNSSQWLAGLATDRWTAVSGSAGHLAQARDRLGDRIRPQDRMLVGNWTDEALLAGEVYDTVLADYLVGAIEGFSPYFQQDIFHRLRPMTGRRLYVVGLDPYVVGPAVTASERMVRAIGRLRDATLLLADETPYREYPAEWTAKRLDEAGFRILTARRFANRYREAWVNGQLDMAVRRLTYLPDQDLAAALAARIEALRQDGLALCRAENGLRSGHDYVIAAEPI